MTFPSAFITWQPVLTDHQAYTYLALQEQSGVSVVSVVTSAEDAVRKSQGWTETNVDALERELVPRRGWFRFFLKKIKNHPDAVHIFASPFQQPKLMIALFLAAMLKADMYLISEPYSPVSVGYYGDGDVWSAKVKSAFRPVFYKFYMQMLRKRLSGIFAISRLAERQYRNAGVAVEKILPFGYFVPFEMKNSAVKPDQCGRGIPRFLFVGSLIGRKGIDILVEAMQELARRDVVCMVDFYGPGDPVVLESCPGARYRGKIPFGEAQAVMADYDLLILPSRHDGWGVVVNEAICAGVPVLCSDTTGAGHAAVALGAGRLFESGNTGSLVMELEQLISHSDLLTELRSKTAAAASRLQPEVAAAYMLESICFSTPARKRIQPPWYGASA